MIWFIINVIFLCLMLIFSSRRVLTITEYHRIYKNKIEFQYGNIFVFITKMEITDERDKTEAFIKLSNGHIICISE